MVIKDLKEEKLRAGFVPDAVREAPKENGVMYKEVFVRRAIKTVAK